MIKIIDSQYKDFQNKVTIWYRGSNSIVQNNMGREFIFLIEKIMLRPMEMFTPIK